MKVKENSTNQIKQTEKKMKMKKKKKNKEIGIVVVVIIVIKIMIITVHCQSLTYCCSIEQLFLFMSSMEEK
ncbi:MAG: hypothetical protein EZS28_052098 [Streblomastix strix]|uniref:Uncharacterized protein n=1 Tax=Streblomastix strix TaxID=222440 RepID=A0A5J4SJB3_9EUKA|nr:MAG: hypothetical protein EZS28_052098 [Streblomastix strix]